MAATTPGELAEFRASVREWCREHVPAGWRQAQTGAADEEYVDFQRAWFAELRQAGFAVPHWPGEWGGGMSAAEQVVLYSELAAHDAPRLVLAFVSIHHAAATLLAAGTAGAARAAPAGHPRRRDLGSGLLRARGGVRPGQPEHHRAQAGRCLRGQRPEAVGQRCDARRLVPAARAHRPGRAEAARDFLLPAGHAHRRASRSGRSARRPASRISARSSSTDVVIPASQLVGPENSGWQVAQATLGAERGMTMLELAERLGNAGLRLARRGLLPAGAGRGAPGRRRRWCETGWPVSKPRSPACGRSAAALVEDHDAGTAGPADASIVKLYYSELLQRMMDFGTEISWPARSDRAVQACLERVGVGCLGAGLHRLVGVDDSRRHQRDPAHHHRRARASACPESRWRADVC